MGENFFRNFNLNDSQQVIPFNLSSISISFVNEQENQEFKKLFPLSNETLKLRKFQYDFITSKKRILFLQTPTGSGKTLAALGRALRPNQNIRSMFIYPTNELMKDQVKSFLNLSNLIGYDIEIFNPEKYLLVAQQNETTWEYELNKDFRNFNSKKILLINLNRETLLELIEIIRDQETEQKEKKQQKLRIGDIVFSLINVLSGRNDINSIIVTNPDFLFFILTNKYKQSKRIWERLIQWNNLVIDEFHLYQGVSLLYLILMIIIYWEAIKYKENSGIAFLSATPSNLYEMFKEKYHDEIEQIKTDIIEEQSINNAIIRYPTKCAYVGMLQDFSNQKNVELIVQITKKIIENEFYINYQSKCHVKLLILVNSNIASENIYLQLKNWLENQNKRASINRIHGLIPKKDRCNIEELQDSILIGTRAIDIGIDFDVPFLIFESYDNAEFFQRLGRGGRHQPAYIFSIGPSELYDSLRNTVSKQPNNALTYLNLQKQVQSALKNQDSYLEFIFSPSGNLITLIFLQAICNPNKNIMTSELEFLYSLICTFKLEDKKMRSFSELISQKVIIPIPNKHNEYRHSKFGYIFGSLSQALSFRGGFIQIPAYFSEFNSWNLIDLYDLKRFNFELKTIENCNDSLKFSIPKAWKLANHDYFLFIEGFNFEICEIDYGFQNIEYVIPEVLQFEKDKIMFKSSNENLTEKINKILSSIPALPFIKTTNRYFDWRIKNFIYFGDKNQFKGKISFGEDAFLLEYLLNREKLGF